MQQYRGRISMSPNHKFIWIGGFWNICPEEKLMIMHYVVGKQSPTL